MIVDGESMGDQKSYTFRNITEPHTIDATFKIGDLYTINASTNFIHFITNSGVPSDNVGVIISSDDAIANIVATAPPKFQIFGYGSWGQSITILKSNLPENIYVRFNPSIDDSGDFEGVLTLKSTEAYAEIKLLGSTNLGIENSQDNQNIVIYPNPTTGHLKIERCDMRYTTCDIAIYDVFGRMLKAENRISQIEKSHIEINISDLSAGIYFVKIFTEEGTVCRKVIKN
jgi:hypothetical protein